jgi:peptide/nickel transport system permease protein/peptide/nickel transport system substrate-binding protein
VASRTGATPEERKVGLSRVQRIALEQAVFVPLMFDANVSAVSKKFTGFEPNVMGRPRYERVVAVG